MPRPAFTREEEYLISYARTHSWSSAIMFDLAYLLPSLALIVFGLHSNEFAAIFVAFGLIASFKVWEWTYQRKILPCWKTIIEKYEETLASHEPQPGG